MSKHLFTRIAHPRKIAALGLIISGLLNILQWPGYIGYDALRLLISAIVWAPAIAGLLLLKGHEKSFSWVQIWLLLLLPSILLHAWVAYAHWSGMLLSGMVYSLLLSVPFYALARYAKRDDTQRALAIFLLLFIAVEQFQDVTEFAWHWYDLGLALAAYPSLIPWYSVTGYSGGTLLLLLLHCVTALRIIGKPWKTAGLLWIALVGSLSCIGIWKGTEIPENAPAQEVVVYQPNAQVYVSKYSTPLREQLDVALKNINLPSLSDSAWVILPENFWFGALDLSSLEESYVIQEIQQNMRSEQRVILGCSTKRIRSLRHVASPSFSEIERNGKGYTSYNSVILLSSDRILGVHHKSKLVPGVETLPYPDLMQPMIDHLFGIESQMLSGNLGSQPTLSSLPLGQKNALLPAVCFESDFSEYLREVRSWKPTVLGVLTNDDWWEDTGGYMQHFKIASVRAIELGLPVIRSANTGISGVINQKGRVLTESNYREKRVLRAVIYPQKMNTWYANNGNRLASLSAFLAVFLLLQMEVSHFRKTKGLS